MTTIPFLFLIFQHFKDHKYIWAAFVEWLAYFTISVEVRVRRRSTKINLLDDNVIMCDRQKSRWMDGQIDDVPMSSNIDTWTKNHTVAIFERERKKILPCTSWTALSLKRSCFLMDFRCISSVHRSINTIWLTVEMKRAMYRQKYYKISTIYIIITIIILNKMYGTSHLASL